MFGPALPPLFLAPSNPGLMLSTVLYSSTSIFLLSIFISSFSASCHPQEWHLVEKGLTRYYRNILELEKDLSSQMNFSLMLKCFESWSYMGTFLFLRTVLSWWRSKLYTTFLPVRGFQERRQCLHAFMRFMRCHPECLSILQRFCAATPEHRLWLAALNVSSCFIALQFAYALQCPHSATSSARLTTKHPPQW